MKNINRIEYPFTLSALELPKNLIDINEQAENRKSWLDKEIVDFKFSENLNRADRYDYMIAALSGAFTATLDIIYCKEFSLLESKKWGSDKINEFVIKVSHKFTENKSNDIRSAVSALEKEYKFPADSLINKFGGSTEHHLRDFSHHPTPIGLVFSILTQFTSKVYGSDAAGNFIIVALNDSKHIGETTLEKLNFGVLKWLLHMTSDMAGSEKTAGKGMGLPGPILSILKELSVLPFIKNIKIKDKTGSIYLYEYLVKLYKGQQKSQVPGIDLRAEFGLYKSLLNDTSPIIFNEIIVSSFYIIRQLTEEIKNKEIDSVEELYLIEIKNVLPYNNRRTIRMKTVSSAVFVAVREGRNLLTQKLKPHPFRLSGFLLNINYPGVIQLSIAIRNDSQYIVEDIQSLIIDYKSRYIEYYEALDLVTFEYFSFEEQERIHFFSMYYDMVKYDIEKTKNKEMKEKKQEWLSKYLEVYSKNSDNHLIQARDKIYYEFLKSNMSIEKLRIYTLELGLSQMYLPFDEKEKTKYISLKVKSNYMDDIFLNDGRSQLRKDYNNMKKLYEKNVAILTNKKSKVYLTAASTITLTAATGGLALAFAPKIAVTLMSGSFVGLKGVALTNASLASLGGGSLAAGGFGMAGGTIVITSGASILGGVGSSALGAIILSQNSDAVLRENSKLLTLVDGIEDEKKSLSILQSIQRDIVKSIYALENAHLIIEGIKEDKKTMKNRKKQEKISLKYYDKTLSQIDKKIEKLKKNKKNVSDNLYSIEYAE
ncbi:MAG: hypothetical protein GX038_00330 [Erysipelothrix sp.]|nr:hypothetical protein [Erysipelothrix sp.]